MALIEIEGLTKVFYPARTFGAWIRTPWQRGRPIIALEDVSLTIEPGELLCVMGRNGAGKTTLLKTLIGLVCPTEGIVRVLGHEVRRTPRRVTSQVGFAAGERTGFYDRLTGRQNLEFFAALHGLPKEMARRRVGELLERFEIPAPDQHYQEYSTGIKQRLVLARSLLHDPQVLLLDEPTKSLDPAHTVKVQTLIKDQLHRAMNKTVIFTTHRTSEAQQLASRIAVLHAGRLCACATVDELKRQGDLALAIRNLCA